MSKTFKPTESELEILSILWDKQSATVREVHEIVQKYKDVGYTTTIKLMQIMNEKGLVTRNVMSKTHIYTPSIQREIAQEQYLNKMIHTLFGGNASQLVIQALGSHETSKSDLDEIKSMINLLQNK
ncbi:MAG: BlaI/MecI/CopY family transcriptional regulator [Sediminibacterium sp.]